MALDGQVIITAAAPTADRAAQAATAVSHVMSSEEGLQKRTDPSVSFLSCTVQLESLAVVLSCKLCRCHSLCCGETQASCNRCKHQ